MRAVALLAGLAAASAQSAWEGPGSKHWKHATHISDPGTLDSMIDEASQRPHAVRSLDCERRLRLMSQAVAGME